MDNRSAALPLLLECFYSGDVPDGSTVSGQHLSTVDRGDIGQLITWTDFALPNSFFNLNIGSKPIYYNQRPIFFSIGGINTIGNWGKYVHPIKFSGGQTLNWTLANNNGLAIAQNINFGLYHYYDWLIEWRKSISITDKLTAFRQGFEHTTTLNQVIEFQDFLIAKNLGDPIGFRIAIFGVTGSPDVIRFFAFVNGILVLSAIPGNFVSQDTDPSLTEWYIPLPPGGNLTIGSLILLPAPNSFSYCVEIMYNNGNGKSS